MHLYLILEIALAYGKDIDDEARVPEMAAVVAATGIAAGAPLALQALDVNPLFALPASGLTAAAVAHLIGETAIQYYARGTEGGQGRCAEPPGAATIDAPNPKPERIPSTPGEPSGMETHEALFPESDEVRLEPAEQPITVTLESPPPEPAATPERPPRAASPTAPARRRKRPIRTRPATT